MNMQQARAKAAKLAKQNDCSYVVVKEFGTIYVLSYESWVVSTLPAYVAEYNADGDNCTEEE